MIPGHHRRRKVQENKAFQYLRDTTSCAQSESKAL
jgi:hypothetical protein